MIKLVYSVNKEDEESEVNWLREQKIFPATVEIYDWRTNKIKVSIGVIVPPSAATAIKLRHIVDTQIEYKQKHI